MYDTVHYGLGKARCRPGVHSVEINATSPLLQLNINWTIVFKSEISCRNLYSRSLLVDRFLRCMYIVLHCNDWVYFNGRKHFFRKSIIHCCWCIRA
jgi:hypothetical protein